MKMTQSSCLCALAVALLAPATATAQKALASSPPPTLPAPSKDCPLYSGNWSRWSDNRGVHVMGSVISLPGWRYSFSPSLRNQSSNKVAVTLFVEHKTPSPGSSVAGTMPNSIEQHVYGFWWRPWGSAPVTTVEINCGHLVQHAGRLPLALPPDPFEVPTVPPPPPPN